MTCLRRGVGEERFHLEHMTFENKKNKRHANTDTKSVQEKKYICVSCKKIASNRRFSFLICNMYSMYVVIGERCCSFLHQWASCIGLDSVVGNIKKVSANLVKSQRWCVKKANKSTILWQWRPSYYTKNMKCIIIQNILTSNLQQAVFHRNIFTK